MAASHHRRRPPDRVGRASSAWPAAASPVDDAGGPTERLEQRRTLPAGPRRPLPKLNEEYQAVLVLREIEGCCYETIADILDLPLGTVRSRLHRARLQLREQLKEVLMIGK